MFGFLKLRKAVDEAYNYCIIMFTKLEEFHGYPVPNKVFNDAYVAGYLQQIIMHAAVMTGISPEDSVKLLRVFENTYDRLVPGLGRHITASVVAVNDPSNPHNANYLVGRREGAEHVGALLNGDQATVNGRMMGFRNFVIRNYLQPENSN